MAKRWLLAAALAAGVGMGSGCSHMHHEDEEDEANEVKMSLDQVPAPVRMTLEREANGATIQHVDMEQNNAGKTTYETDVMLDGKNWEIRVAPDGKLLSKKIDREDDEKSSKKGKEEDDEKH